MLCYDALQATHKHTERLGFGLTHYWCHETKVFDGKQIEMSMQSI